MLPEAEKSVAVMGKHVLVLPGGEVSIRESAQKIFGCIGEAQRMFFRGGRVHEIVGNPDGSSRLDPISPAQFRSRVEEFGPVFAWRSGANNEKVLKPVICPEETAAALLASLAAQEMLPNVTVLSGCPVLGRLGDEMAVLGPGWHGIGGGIFVTGGEMPPDIPLDEAVEALRGLLSDFDFATAGDHSRALASLVAPALRFGEWLRNPLPVDMGEANASQSGKTYRQKIVAAIYRQTPNVVVQRSSGVGGLDESIAQKLIDGQPFILMDNFRGKLDSPFLESLLTAPGPMPARVPHRGEVRVDPRGFVFQMTSNGMETTRDLVNRASLIRIKKQPGGYTFKTYREGDLHGHVVARQAYYLGCVFSVITAWVEKGQQTTNEKRHDFREWAGTLDWIVQEIFGAAPLLDGHDEARQRVCDPRRVWLRNLCIALRDGPQSGKVDFFAAQLAEFAIENEILPPGVRPDAAELDVARKIGGAMKHIFGENDEVKLDGFVIRRSEKTVQHTGNRGFVYQFDEEKRAA